MRNSSWFTHQQYIQVMVSLHLLLENHVYSTRYKRRKSICCSMHRIRCRITRCYFRRSSYQSQRSGATVSIRWWHTIKYNACIRSIFIAFWSCTCLSYLSYHEYMWCKCLRDIDSNVAIHNDLTTNMLKSSKTPNISPQYQSTRNSIH